MTAQELGQLIRDEGGELAKRVESMPAPVVQLLLVDALGRNVKATTAPGAERDAVLKVLVECLLQASDALTRPVDPGTLN